MGNMFQQREIFIGEEQWTIAYKFAMNKLQQYGIHYKILSSKKIIIEDYTRGIVMNVPLMSRIYSS